MNISVSDAKAQLTELVRRAEAGDEIVLTRHGKPAVRLTPVEARPTQADKAAWLRAFLEEPLVVSDGPDAARSQDYLYDEDGLPK